MESILVHLPLQGEAAFPHSSLAMSALLNAILDFFGSFTGNDSPESFDGFYHS